MTEAKATAHNKVVEDVEGKKSSAEDPKNIQQKSKSKKNRPKYLYVNVAQAYYPLIQEALEGIGFRVTESETKANLFWINQNGSVDTASELLPFQFYNHFPGTVAISRKVDLAKNLDASAHIMPEAFSFNPKSYIMPLQYNDLKNYMLSIKNPRQRTFIIKPDKGSLGKGIILVQDPSHLETYTQNAIAQKYIDPYLIDGLKFDLRIYVLVTSIEPLRMYVFTEGMARFCTEPYHDPQPNNLDQVFSHLTNYSLNKKNEHFQANEIVDHEEKGNKRSMTSIFESVRKNGHDVEKLKHQIDEVLRLTIASAQPYIASQYRIGITSNDGKSRCFEILGFDILLDKDCKPWLLEVNNKPSMAAESEFDHKLKMQVVQEAMKIINLQPNFKKSVNQRIKELSQCSRQQAQLNTKFYDPEGETQRAKTTKWKQLYPLLDGEVSDIEKALQVARQVSGLRSRRDQTQQIASTQQAPEKAQNTLKKANTSKSQVASQQIIPIQRKGIKTPSQRIFRPKQKTEKTVQPVPSSIQQARILSRASLRVTRTPRADEGPLLLQMRGLEPNTIYEEEERERLKNIRRQAQIASGVSCLQRVKAMLSVVGSSPKKYEGTTYIQPAQAVAMIPTMSTFSTMSTIQSTMKNHNDKIVIKSYGPKQFTIADAIV